MSILSTQLKNIFGIGAQDPNVYESLMGGQVGAITQQQQNLANQMLQGVPQQQQQQIYGTAADEAAMQNQMAQQNLAMSGMEGGANFGSMLSAMTQNRMRGGASQQIAALQPKYQQMGANLLSEVRGVYEGANQAQLESDLAKRQRQRSNLGLVAGALGTLAFPGAATALAGGGAAGPGLIDMVKRFGQKNMLKKQYLGGGPNVA